MELAKKVDRLYAEYARIHGLSFMSFNVLEVICTNPDSCTQKMISEETGYSKQSVNMIIKGFLEQGYVELKELSNDRRNKKILLTQAGISWAEELLIPVRGAEQKANARLSHEDWTLLLHTLTRYTETFEKEMLPLLHSDDSSLKSQ